MDSIETKHRPAARVVCLDAAHRVLLMHWQDPVGGAWLWEPPGGGIDPGETPLQAARRELGEETGLDGAAVMDLFTTVERDVRWNGQRFVGPEPFYLARFPTDRPAVTRSGLMADEEESLLEYRWVSAGELSDLTDRIEPPQLFEIVAHLTGNAPPWRVTV